MSDAQMNLRCAVFLCCLVAAGLVVMALGLSGALSPATDATQPADAGSGGRSLSPLEDRYRTLPHKRPESDKRSRERRWAEYQERLSELKRRKAAGELLLRSEQYDLDHPLQKSDFE
jgi:hypothetical protein